VELGIGYGVIILSISGVLVLLFGMIPSPAYANNFIVDNFTDDSGPQAGACDFALTTGMTSLFVQTGMLGVIDMIRECQFTITVDNFPREGEIQVVEAAGMFSQTSQTGVKTDVLLLYDGEEMPASGRSLGLDLTNSVNLRITYSKAQFQVDVSATLIDSDGDSATLNGILAPGINSAIDLNFPLANFAAQNALLNLNDIDEINFHFTTTTDATDYDLDLIDINMITSPDSDGDGVPDSQDICPNFDDNIDTDSDGIPDGCDENPTLSCGPGTTLEGFVCLCTQIVGGALAPIDTISLLAAGIGVDPIISGLLLLSMVGISFQVGWMLHKRKSNKS